MSECGAMRGRVCRAVALLSLAILPVAGGGAREAGDASAPTLRAERIPPRPEGASSGSEFARRTTGWAGAERQRAMVEELSRGNLPEFLRWLRPIEISGEVAAEGRSLSARLWVMPDYLAIGSDEDFLRVPLEFDSAVRVANRFGCILPTPKIVDAIYRQATVKLDPIPMPPGLRMRSSDYYLRHQRLIERQRESRPLGELTAGHKKDVVITNRLYRRAGRIAIYGWHRSIDDSIQPLSTVHGENYADYSHGVRLVLATLWIDGEPSPILDVLRDPARAPLLTYEGVIREPRRLMTP